MCDKLMLNTTARPHRGKYCRSVLRDAHESTTSIRLNAGSSDETSRKTPKRICNLSPIRFRRVKQAQRTYFPFCLLEHASHIADHLPASGTCVTIFSLGKAFESGDIKSEDVEVLRDGVAQVACDTPASVILSEEFLGNAPEIAHGLVLVCDVVPMYQDVVRMCVRSVA